MPGKRRKHRGDYKVSQATTTYKHSSCSYLLSLLWQLPVAVISLFPVSRNCVAFRLDVLRSMSEERGAKFLKTAVDAEFMSWRHTAG